MHTTITKEGEAETEASAKAIRPRGTGVVLVIGTALALLAVWAVWLTLNVTPPGCKIKVLEDAELAVRLLDPEPSVWVYQLDGYPAVFKLEVLYRPDNYFRSPRRTRGTNT